MLERYYVKPQTIDRIKAHWMGEAIERYVTWLHERGYGARNVFRRVPWLLHFGTYAQSQGAMTWAELPKYVSSFVHDWTVKHGGNCRSERARKSVANAVRGPIEQMIRLLVPEFAPTGRQKPFPFYDQAPGFVDHLRNERGLRPATIRSYQILLRHLEKYLAQIKMISLRELSPPVLSAFVTSRSAGWGTSMLVELCGALRVFLRYLFREKLIAQDLSQTVEGPREYRLASIPRSISWTDVERMLKAVDRRSPVGKRDYAILLLLVTYGLRGREVAALTLDDLDWEHERLRVPERKAGHSTAYPLSTIVGEAIVDYLKHGRPAEADRHVFYRAMAPFGPATISIKSALPCRALGLIRCGTLACSV
jgi:site-specific recombinase XerC